MIRAQHWHFRSTWGLLVASLLASLPGAASGAAGRDCFREIERGRGPDIVCEFPTRLTDDERRDLRRITRDLLLDANCVVSIRIQRRDLDAALAAEDEVFEAPPQPVRCEIATRERVVPITGTFTPRVTFAAGRAVEATPGLDGVEGVPAMLAWPVLQSVTRAGSIQDGMIAAINA